MLPPPTLSPSRSGRAVIQEASGKDKNKMMNRQKPWSVPTIVMAVIAAAVLIMSLVFLISVMR